MILPEIKVNDPKVTPHVNKYPEWKSNGQSLEKKLKKKNYTI